MTRTVLVREGKNGCGTISPMNLKERNLKERLDRWGIKVALFDFDDTLIKTSEIFGVQMRAYIGQIMARLGTQEFDEVFAVFERINNEQFKKFAVNPNGWASVADEMGRLYPEAGETVVDCLPTLM